MKVENMVQEFDFRDEDFTGFLQEFIDSGILDESNENDKTAIGVSKRLITEGYDSISPKQQKVIDIIANKHFHKLCTHCGDSIPWCEMMFAIEHNGMCSHCVHIWNDIKEE